MVHCFPTRVLWGTVAKKGKYSLTYREKFQTPLDISWEFLSGNHQYWSNFHAVPTACLFGLIFYRYDILGIKKLL